MELVDLLVSAGYFRAGDCKIPIFDRIAGGFCWCIQLCCSFERKKGVETDVFFTQQQHLSIRQKIHLSEDIVQALTSLHCTLPIQPHQIQGCDVEALLPVGRWLIQTAFDRLLNDSVENRKDTELYYNQNFQKPTDDTPPSVILEKLQQHYRPERLFKLKEKQDELYQGARVQRCLFEYGEKSIRLPTPIDLKEKDLEIAQKKARDKAKILFDLQEKHQDVLIRESKQTDSTRADSTVQKLLRTNTKTQDAITLYNTIQEEMAKKLQAIDPESGQHVFFARQKASLQKKIAEVKSEVVHASKERESVAFELQTTKQHIEETNVYNDRIKAETEKLILKDESDSAVAQLKQLVALNESQKRQEKEMKASCIQKLQVLRKKAAGEGIATTEELERLEMIEAKHKEVYDKFTSLQRQIAKVSQSIGLKLRQIDEIPTRIELIQYERRFVELYDESALKLDETRKYFSVYNTLEETLKHMRKEVSLIDSINENFTEAMSQNEKRTAYLTQLEKITENVGQLLTKQQNVLEKKQFELETLDSKYKMLLERQQNYFSAIKQFQFECERNKELNQ